MKLRRLKNVLVVAAIAAASTARAEIGTATIEAFGGYQNLDPKNIGGVGDLSSQGTAIVGGDILAGLGGFGVGAVVDKTVSGRNQPWAGALMAGVLIPLTVVRIELMGELGRRGLNDFGDLFRERGQTFVGFRPGVSFRFAPTPIVIGVSGIARWPTSGGDFGSPDYGIVGRIGFGIF
jgi:hypothetical protein